MSVRAKLLSMLLALATAMLAAVPARASSPSCTGADLVARMEREDKAAYDAFAGEAAALVNGEGLLWKIEKKGVRPSFLFGTFHATDGRLMAVAERAAPQLRASRALATELGEMTKLAKGLAIAQVALKAMNAQTDTLALIRDDGKRARIEELLRERRLSRAEAGKMEPWLLVTLFALPVCEMLKPDRNVVDDRVVEIAAARKIPVHALETVDEQLASLASIRSDFVLRYLESLAERPSLIDDAFETMVRLYVESRVSAALPALRHATKMSAEDVEINRQLIAALMGKRNANMLERSRPLLAKGGAFVAVGALHLSGPDGLVELYRKDGYKVTKVW